MNKEKIKEEWKDLVANRKGALSNEDVSNFFLSKFDSYVQSAKEEMKREMVEEIGNIAVRPSVGDFPERMFGYRTAIDDALAIIKKK
jgi:hypothetical protein